MRKIIFLFLLVAFPALAQAPESPQNAQISVLNSNTLKPISTTNYQQNKTLGAISEDLFSGLKYRTIIKCLAKYESNYNIHAVGKAGERGILQYKEATFQHFCEGDWENPLDQILCTDRLLTQDFGLISHWTTRKLCLTTD